MAFDAGVETEVGEKVDVFLHIIESDIFVAASRDQINGIKAKHLKDIRIRKM